VARKKRPSNGKYFTVFLQISIARILPRQKASLRPANSSARQAAKPRDEREE
jgi:hypothetical protein